MKVGQLYKFIEIPFNYLDTRKEKEWEGAVLLYLGENTFFQAEGITVTNHLFYTNGNQTLFPTQMLKYLQKIE